MFTGIVSDIGVINSVQHLADDRVTIRTRYDTESIDFGASIACSGVCLTVVDKGAGWFAVDVSAETMSRTAQGQWAEGQRLNLERAMRLGDEMGGHIVTGHVDGVGEVISVEQDGASQRVIVTAGHEIAPFVSEKGSVTLDGVSLTINSVEDTPRGVRIGVNLIPHTAAKTTFDELEVSRAVNIEIDVLARYLQRLEQYRATT